MSDTLRITGMASGLDIDGMVKTMMKAENMKVDKLKQDQQIVQWKQDMYRDLMGDLNTFKSTYFDVLKPDTYMLSTKNYSSFDIASTLASGASTTAVTATAGAGAVAGTYTVNVGNLATKAMAIGNAINVKEASNGITFGASIIKGSNDALKLTIGGTDYSINIDAGNYNSLSDLASNINSKFAADTTNKLSDKVEAVVSTDGKSIQLNSKLMIDDNNKVLNFDINDGTTTNHYTVTLDTGSYTLDELKTQISNKLKSAKNTVDNSTSDISSQINIDISNGSNVAFTPGTGISSISTNHTNDYSVPSLVTTNVNTNQIIANNNLNYGQKITTGINNILTVKFGGNSYDINLGDIDYTNSSNIIDDLKTRINNQLSTISDLSDPTGNVKLSDILQANISLDGTKLQFTSLTDKQVNISGNIMSTLGYSNVSSAGIDLNLSTSDKMSTLFNSTNSYNGKVSFNVNRKDFSYDFGTGGADQNKTIGDVLNQISSQANVNISYSQLTRKFTINSNSTGASQAIVAVDKDILDNTNTPHATGFIDTLFGSSSINTGNTATAAKYDFTLSGDNLVDGNTVSIDGVTYTAKAAGTTTLGSYDFIIGTDIKATAANLAAKVSGTYKATADANGKITLTQTTPSAGANPTVAVGNGATTTVSNVTVNTPYTAPMSESANIKKGKDAQVTITEPNSASSVTINQSSNNFTIDGVSYTLNDDKAGPVNITLTSNPQKTYDKIKDFVDKYNDIIDKINTKLYEKKQYDYKPLTDDQKTSMKDDEIKQWEDKAKQGLLANDSTLSNMLSNMRSAFYDAVKVNYNDPDGSSIGISFSGIGITTSSDVSERGKLIIDETTLKNAIQNNGDKVMQLFTKVSNYAPSYSPSMASDARSNRYKEEGIFQRVSDILQDNLRTIRDNNGMKGTLLEKAGIKGDYTEFHNILTDDIVERDKAIKDLQSKLADKENQYYQNFSKLETAMQQMNSQSSWLSQQIGSMAK